MSKSESDPKESTINSQCDEDDDYHHAGQDYNNYDDENYNDQQYVNDDGNGYDSGSAAADANNDDNDQNCTNDSEEKDNNNDIIGEVKIGKSRQLRPVFLRQIARLLTEKDESEVVHISGLSTAIQETSVIFNMFKSVNKNEDQPGVFLEKLETRKISTSRSQHLPQLRIHMRRNGSHFRIPYELRPSNVKFRNGRTESEQVLSIKENLNTFIPPYEYRNFEPPVNQDVATQNVQQDSQLNNKTKSNVGVSMSSETITPYGSKPSDLSQQDCQQIVEHSESSKNLANGNSTIVMHPESQDQNLQQSESNEIEQQSEEVPVIPKPPYYGSIYIGDDSLSFQTNQTNHSNPNSRFDPHRLRFSKMLEESGHNLDTLKLLHQKVWEKAKKQPGRVITLDQSELRGIQSKNQPQAVETQQGSLTSDGGGGPLGILQLAQNATAAYNKNQNQPVAQDSVTAEDNELTLTSPVTPKQSQNNNNNSNTTGTNANVVKDILYCSCRANSSDDITSACFVDILVPGKRPLGCNYNAALVYVVAPKVSSTDQIRACGKNIIVSVNQYNVKRNRSKDDQLNAINQPIPTPHIEEIRIPGELAISESECGRKPETSESLREASSLMEGLFLNPSAQIDFSPTCEFCYNDDNIFEEAFDSLFAEDHNFIHAKDGEFSISAGGEILLEEKI